MANNTGTFFNINDNDGIPLVGVSTNGKVMINHLYGNCLIGSTSVTGTSSQPLQVTGGVYFSGSVGIGTTNPGYNLDVQGTQNVTDQISLWGRTIGQPQTLIEPGKIYATSAGLGPGDLLLQPTGGNLGIGTTNPTSKLQVIGDARVGIDTSSGVILTAENGTKYRLIVSTAGVLSTVLVP
jgi:hypothetical protein